ncbi:MAG: Gx transporter family protein [Thermodesulfovibrionales bacterium]|nr:Gx transporter family protein [Thermodesulfovibrionales bacterium]
MQSQDKYRIALLSAYAIAIHSFESMLPTPIPWLRLGVANIITLATLVLYGFRAAMMVTLIRVILSSIFIGTFLGPGFIMSLGGGVTSTFAMGIAFSIFPRLFGPVGLSLIGALFHNIAQLFLAYILFVQKIEPILIVSPILILLGTITGIVNGVIAGMLIKNIPKEKQSSA